MQETNEKAGYSKDLPNKSTTTGRNEHSGNAQTKYELAIRRGQINLLELSKDAIEKRFNVKIHMPWSGSSREQRIHIVGLEQACQQANIYVRSLCEPDVVEIREFPDEMLPFLSSDVQRFKIETDSGAVLLFSSSMEGMVVIQGSNEMSVMLALSILEELIREHTEGPSDAPSTSGTVDNTSDRLNETLNDLIDPPGSDTNQSYECRNLTDVVKRSLIKSLIDEQNQETIKNTEATLSDGAAFRAPAIDDLTTAIIGSSSLSRAPSEAPTMCQKLRLLWTAGMDDGFTEYEIETGLINYSQDQYPELDEFIDSLHANRNGSHLSDFEKDPDVVSLPMVSFSADSIDIDNDETRYNSDVPDFVSLPMVPFCADSIDIDTNETRYNSDAPDVVWLPLVSFSADSIDVDNDETRKDSDAPDSSSGIGDPKSTGCSVINGSDYLMSLFDLDDDVIDKKMAILIDSDPDDVLILNKSPAKTRDGKISTAKRNYELISDDDSNSEPGRSESPHVTSSSSVVNTSSRCKKKKKKKRKVDKPQKNARGENSSAVLSGSQSSSIFRPSGGAQFINRVERCKALHNRERLKITVPNSSASSHLKWAPRRRVEPVLEQDGGLLPTPTNFTSPHLKWTAPLRRVETVVVENGGRNSGGVSSKNPPENAGDCVASSISVRNNILPLSETAKKVAAIGNTTSITSGDVGGFLWSRPPQCFVGSCNAPNYNNSSKPSLTPHNTTRFQAAPFAVGSRMVGPRCNTLAQRFTQRSNTAHHPINLRQILGNSAARTNGNACLQGLSGAAAFLRQPPGGPPFVAPINRPLLPANASASLRYVVIDGSNVAMSHGKNKIFSSRGIEIVVNFFLSRGHRAITAFVPQNKRQASSVNNPGTVSDRQLLEQLSDQGYVVFTPSRRIGDRNITCYDDRFILNLASQTNGIVVSNDNYRDLQLERRAEWHDVLNYRILPFSFVNDLFMAPDDPLGRHGPRLDEFLIERRCLPPTPAFTDRTTAAGTSNQGFAAAPVINACQNYVAHGPGPRF